MIAKIVQLLRQRKPNAPQEWLDKLPQMAKRLEESLYRSAGSFDEYNDIGTLKQRLQQLAMNIGMKTKKMQQQQQAQIAQGQQSGQLMTQQQQTYPPQTYTQQPHQMQPANHSQNGKPPMAPQPVPQQVRHQQPLMQIPTQQPVQQRQMVNMSDINPMMGGTNHSQPVASAPPPGRSSVSPMVQTNYQPAPSMAHPHAPHAGAPSPAAPVPTAPAGAPSSSGSRQPSDRQQVLRHQQQRLLLLRHAAKCPHQDGQCPVTPHCAGMKRLWKHIAECKDQKCAVPHCVSSRYVLSHYHRCKDVRCPVCGPVREAIHRSHEKQKQMQALKQGHQQALQQNQLPAPAPPAPPVATPQPAPVATAQQLIAAPGATPAGAVQYPPTKRQKTANGQYVTSQTPHQPGAPPQQYATQPPHQQQPPYQPQPPHIQQPPTVQQSAHSQQAPPTQQPHPQQSAPLPHHPEPQPSNAAAPGQVFASAASVTPSAVQPTALAAPVLNPNIKAGYVYSHPPGKPVSAPSQPVAPAGVALSNGKVLIQQGSSGTKPQEDHTLINCFTLEQIETHIKSLNKGLQLPPAKLKTKCGEVLKGLQTHAHGWVFNTPVDPVELGLPDYFEVIKNPMDLGTIKKGLDNGRYHSLNDFESDVHLTFDNAMLYNPEGSVVYTMAKELKEKFVIDFAALVKEVEAEEEEKRKNGDACSLCGCEKLLFEPPVFYCNGLNCRSKRIRRNSYYYVGGNNQYHWCQPCYDELKESQTIEFPEITLKKSQLDKKKNNEVPEESWVQCDRCERWIHQICALFNTRQNKDQRSEFMCPSCTIVDRKKKNNLEPSSSTPMAEDLPRTRLSEHLEKHVREKFRAKMAEMSQEKAEAEGIPLEEATELTASGGGEIYVRQVTSMSRTLDVRERMRKRYSFKDYPSEFKYRCKCVIVFQNLDGVDVILFGLYVYEHDETNSPPNQRAVYISYLDSVHYMRPRRMRTFVYHELLIAYLDYVRNKGYSTAHIWACPPLKGDDYILFAKPEDQKTPKDDRLRQWYLDMLKESQKRGIVGRLTNAYDLYFANEKNDATVLPYMEGDYFPAELENIIKDLEEGRTSKKSDGSGKKKGKKDKKKSGSRGGTRSTGLDEKALAASGIIPDGVDVKSIQLGGRDYVMTKLGETIFPMKESFLVAFLDWEGVKEENRVVPKDIMEYREQHGIITRKHSDDTKNGNCRKESSEDTTDVNNANEAGSDSKAEVESKEKAESSKKGDCHPPDGSKKEEKKDDTDPGSAGELGKGINGEKSNDDGKKDEVSAKQVPQKPEKFAREGKFAAMEKRKRDMEGSPKPESITSSDKAPSSSVTKDSKGRLVKVIDDDEEEMDCEFLNNRQLFLNLCQGNHYQFDQLRRAKHTSMMVLWHLHNRDAPKFVQQCALCSREILSGKRYHCPTCADYDQCYECISNPNVPRHQHPLTAIPVGNQQSALTEEQRKERQRSIQLHMTLLLHASTCRSTKCTSANCAKMKGLLKHGSQCKIKANGGCQVCKRIWALLQIHARQCKQDNCPVPNCMAIRERFRQLTLQQQAMDDRRRQAMNGAYHQQAR